MVYALSLLIFVFNHKAKDSRLDRARRSSGAYSKQCHVNLLHSDLAKHAVTVLDKASVLDRRVRLGIMMEERLIDTKYRSCRINLESGWFASQDPVIFQANMRKPLTTYHYNLFAPLRESRRVVFENVPVPYKMTVNQVLSDLYRLSHTYDVLGIGQFFAYMPRNRALSG